MRNPSLRALGYQQITDMAAATALTIPAGTAVALIQCEGAGVRWRDDGVDPTTSVGMLLNVGDELEYDAGVGLASLKFIELAATAVLNISYYGG